jgi:SNF2 family DNA or RNA helicase
MVIVTTAGGVAITLDQADSIHILDETWTPDDQEQLEDRIHRVSRVHNVTVYKYRSNNSIEQYIAGVNFDKAMINRNILELRRKGIIHG